MKKIGLTAALVLLVSLPAMAANTWIDEPDLSLNLRGMPVSGVVVSRYLSADDSALRNTLSRAPTEGEGGTPSTITLPMPDGQMQTFNLVETQVLTPESAAMYPDFKAYRVSSKSDPAVTGVLDMLPDGFHAYLLTKDATVYIDPDRNAPGRYRSYYKHEQSAALARPFSCGVVRHDDGIMLKQVDANTATPAAKTVIDHQLLNYDIAIGTTYEYSQAIQGGGSINISKVQAEIFKAISRVNVVYNRDLGINLLLVQNDNLISTDPNDNLTNNDSTTLIFEAKAFIDNAIGASNYDIGHIFSTGAGGLASQGVVCDSNYKAEGVTGIDNPTGDLFYIDYVAHEIGHQFGADHTFNGTSGSCGGDNRNASTAYEPGSGSTIMGYAGICDPENVQTSSVVAGGASDDMFHAGSIAQIVAYSRSGGGAACAAPSGINTSNTAPTVNFGTDDAYTIPGLTPFVLTPPPGAVNDIDGDPVSYQWDEMDTGRATNATTYGTDLCDNPLFRSQPQSASESRYLPAMATIISGIPDKAEKLPNNSRVMDFRLTVRDDKGGVGDDDMQVAVDDNSGPFQVLSGAQSQTLDTSLVNQHVVEWNAACTEQAPVNCTNVDITLSTDGGVSYSYTLAANTPNDGSEIINFPNVTSSNAYIKIQCTGNIFFDINDAPLTLQNGTGTVLAATGSGGSYACGTATFGCDISNNTLDTSGATPVDINEDIPGSINQGDIDVYSFTADGSTYTFTLQDYGDANLDLMLADANGYILVQSASSTSTTETIQQTLNAGSTYYLAVAAVTTNGETSYRITTSTGVNKSSGSSSSALSPWLWIMPLALALLRRRIVL